MRSAFFTFLLAFSLIGFARELPPITFKDQWDKDQVLDERTRLVIFSHHKEGSRWVKDALDGLQIADLSRHHWLYVADISTMPAMISKVMAIPKMRQYPFAIALIKKDHSVPDWPVAEDAVAVYELNRLEITRIYQVKSEEDLKNLLHEEMKTTSETR